MKLITTLLAVKSVEVSKKFYSNLFDQKVVLDLGRNLTFSGGFSIQEDFAWLTNIDVSSVMEKSHNMELYFEVEDFDSFLHKLENYSDVKYVHQPKKYEWHQRVVRIYDPDFHIIEIGESMIIIAQRYLKQGYTVEETSKIIQHPIEFIEMCKKGL